MGRTHLKNKPPYVTIKQERAVNELVENGGNVSKAMRAVGYSKETAKTPQKLTESKGFQWLCNKQGLTDTLLIDALVEDIKSKKRNRKAELELAFKVKGRLHTEVPGFTFNTLIINTEQQQRIAQELLKAKE